MMNINLSNILMRVTNMLYYNTSYYNKYYHTVHDSANLVKFESIDSKNTENSIPFIYPHE